jgi:CRISPR-associated endonuclease Csn1
VEETNMAVYLGLDIGSNSIGTAWVDTDTKEITLGVSVFPAGVEESEDKRGAPKNQARRLKRSQRRNIARRARRKRLLIRFLMGRGLLPKEPAELQTLFDFNPWILRRKAIKDPVTPFEFGRVLVHLGQRRGAVGVTIDSEGDDEEQDVDRKKVKAGMDRLKVLMKDRNAETVGQLLADLLDERRQQRGTVSWQEPIRNRQYRMPEDQQLFAGRELIRSEFHRMVEVQRSFHGTALAGLLTNDLVAQLDDPRQTKTWRHQGLLFGQRRTYWKTGTLGRCALEPTERCVPIADRHASYFRVVEFVNNIRIQRRGSDDLSLTGEERERVIRLLSGPFEIHTKGKQAGKPKSKVTIADIKKTLGISPRDKSVKLNIEADEHRDVNTDWFCREIVHGAFTVPQWQSMTESQRESVNRAILRFEPENEEDAARLHAGAQEWWSLPPEAADKLVLAWRTRPKLEKRLNLSRRAIINLLPYMDRYDEKNHRWSTQQEARKLYASVLQDRYAATGDRSDQIAAQRYAVGVVSLTAADRRYMRLVKHQIKHNGEVVHDVDGHPLAALPPAPTLSNPVVRKAVHEVRRHLLAYLHKFRRKPDRVVVELARITKQSERQRNAVLVRNRHREKIRKSIIEETLATAYGEAEVRTFSLNQQRAALDRVILAKQQLWKCPYCGGAGLTDRIAAKGDGLDIDHIVPYSRSGDDSLNNRVLVHRECNRGKANLTPREWWGADFEQKAGIAEKLFKLADPQPQDYFTKRDYARKWRNFTREIREDEEFKNSQLTDTAYAARQVATYLADALFDGRGLPERGDGEEQQRIFFTVGRITLMLRKDWQLFETLKPETRGIASGMTADEELQLAAKNRGDHREHAIDAVTIALTDPKIKTLMATWAADAAEFRDKYGRGKKRSPLPPPWGTVESFRDQVLSKARALIVSHRPVKRRLAGAFHKETHYGPVMRPLPRHRTEEAETLFTNRIPIADLTPNHLRVPDGWDELSAQLDKADMSNAAKRSIRCQLAALEDPRPETSGLVRDRALRDRLRKCLRANGLDPDDFTKKEIKGILAERNLTHASGVPIKSVVLLWTIVEPVLVPRKKWDWETNRMVNESDHRTLRVYFGGNNHHVEIRVRPLEGKRENSPQWVGQVVTMFEAVKRNTERLNALRNAGLPNRSQLERLPKGDRCRYQSVIADIDRRFAIVDRCDNEHGAFVMSLAEGETIHCRRKDRPDDPPDYYVVCKIRKQGNSCRIYFAPHWDARKANEQDRWNAAPAGLRDCGPVQGESPYKVQVGPLGGVTRHGND